MTKLAVHATRTIQRPSPASAQWGVWVQQGRELVERESGTRWRLGDLALEVWPIAESGTRTGSWERLDRYAEEIGIQGGTLRTYRRGVGCVGTLDTYRGCVMVCAPGALVAPGPGADPEGPRR